MLEPYKAAFFVIPSRIIELPNITLAYIKIYETIFQFWNHRKNCYLSNQAIMERTGISSESTLREAFIFFEHHGQLIRMSKGSRRYLVDPSNQIEIIDEITMKDTKKVGVDLATGGRRQSDGGGVDLATHNNKNINNKKKNKDKSYSASDEARPQKKSRFNEFKIIYPNQRDMYKAEKIWIKNKLDGIADIILADLKNRMANDSQWQDKKFIPHASTYLNGRRWEDEISLQKIARREETPMERSIRMNSY